MNAIKRFFRAMQYATEDRKWSIYRDEMMLPPMRKHYDVRGIEQMAAYDFYLDELEKKRLELIKDKQLPTAREIIPAYLMKEDRAGYAHESLERTAAEIFP